MAHELRELLHEAAAEPADDLDVDDLRRRGRRARRRRRLATAGGAAVVVVLLAAGLLVGVNELSGPPDVAVEDGRSVLPPVDRQVVAEGTFDDGGLGWWSLEAWTRGGDELCLEGPTGSTCAHLMPGRTPFRMTSVGTGERDGIQVGCAVGAVRPRVATLEVVFASGTSQLLTPEVNDAFGLRFYATCWTGQRPLREVNGLDADGQQVASMGYDVTVEATEESDDGQNIEIVAKQEGAPAEPAHAWVAWAHTGQGLQDLWGSFGLDGDPPRLSGQAVVLAATGESSSCPSRLTDATVEGNTLHLSVVDEPAITPPPDDYTCTADFNPVTFVLRVERNLVERVSVVDFGDTEISLGPAGEVTSEDSGG